MSNWSIWPCQVIPHRGLNGPRSDSNEGVLYIPQISSITWASPSDFSMSYQRHSLVGGFLAFADLQSVYSTAPADWSKKFWFGCDRVLPQQKCSAKTPLSWWGLEPFERPLYVHLEDKLCKYIDLRSRYMLAVQTIHFFHFSQLL